MCRHTVGLNWTAIGIEHVGTSDRQILGNTAQLSASLALTLWLTGRYQIQLRNVIGHSESLTSPYHHERYRAVALPDPRRLAVTPPWRSTAEPLTATCPPPRGSRRVTGPAARPSVSLIQNARFNRPSARRRESRLRSRMPSAPTRPPTGSRLHCSAGHDVALLLVERDRLGERSLRAPPRRRACGAPRRGPRGYPRAG